MSNWKNVNNCHWVNKNCVKWAETYFTDKIVGTEVTKDKNTVKITALETITGDVDLNQRKGKLITIFDVALTYAWKGTLADGTEVSGKIFIPEVAHDTDSDDYVFDVTIDEDKPAKHVVRGLIKKELGPVLSEKLARFSDDLIKQHSSDVYIDPSQLGQAAPPRAAHPGAKEHSATHINTSTTSTTSTSSPAPKTVNTTTIKDTTEFLTSAKELYNTLLDPGRASIWSRGPAKIADKVGTKFEFFNGNVTGEIKELEPEKKIVQSWRLKSWPQGHYSTVTITLDQTNDCVKLHMQQTGVPVGEEELTRNNWNGYYWRAIKETFGFGANF
ncbi:activator of Hsp90 ATPase [Phycomyces nitens]|nr:activator of Hsp90 ATPase [Phycomyces nitens]